MKLIDVPVYNDDGTVKFTVSVDAPQSKALLEFALNFLVTSGFVLQADTMQTAKKADGTPVYQS